MFANEPEELDFIVRLFISGLIGAIIGLEREIRAKEAGIRTHFLVALGSALFMIISQHAFGGSDHFDASRVAAQVVSGIGDEEIISNTCVERIVTVLVEAAVERISGTSRVVIADDSAEKDIRGGGLEVRPGMAVAVVPPPDAGTDEYRSAKKKAYIEILRQLKGRGCRLAARDMSSARFPVDMDKLEGYIMANGYDTGYNMALAESAAEAPSAELVIEVLDCQMDMVSGRSKVVVRMRSPLEYGGEMKSRSFRSKVPDKNICRAVSSLFAEK